MKKIKNKNFIYIGAFLLFAVAMILLSEQDSNQDYDAVVYKSPSCSCCREYISYMEKNGYKINQETTSNMDSIRDKHGINPEMESCHTMVINDYVVEGHVPIEVVEKLLEKKPNIPGISLPDMPSGSPGMPGTKREPFTIHSLAQNNPVYINY